VQQHKKSSNKASIPNAKQPIASLAVVGLSKTEYTLIKNKEIMSETRNFKTKFFSEYSEGISSD
jgi:hypothetical protein